MSKLPKDVEEARLLWTNDEVRVVIHEMRYGPNKVVVERTNICDSFGELVWIPSDLEALPIEFFNDAMKWRGKANG